MNEQIQKAFDEWKEIIDPDGEERRFVRLNRDLSTQALCFHGGYTACQARIREVIEGKIAAYVMELECYDEYTIWYLSIKEKIARLRELLGEI